MEKLIHVAKQLFRRTALQGLFDLVAARRHRIQKLSLAGLFVVSVCAFQNCSPFTVTRGSTNLSSTLDVNFEKGRNLYSQKCARCHGDISVSTKKTRTIDQVNDAISNQTMMFSLSGLSQDDRNLIVYALSDRPSTAPIYSCADPLTRGLSADRIRRLSKLELTNTLRVLLGPAIFNDSVVQGKLGGLAPDQIKKSPADFGEAAPNQLAPVLFDISKRAAEMFAADANLRSSMLDTCAAQALTDVCIRTIAGKFGAKVYRRPLTTAEVDDALAFYTAMGSGSDGLQLFVIRFLQSPSLVFHDESGGTTVVNGRFRLTDYEIASRISYQASNSMPDPELTAAAARGELQNIDRVREQVTRLLASNEAHDKVSDFFSYYTRLQTDPVFSTKVTTYAQIDTTNLGSAMRQEAADFNNYIVWTKTGNFKDLMTSTASFPRTPAMASILGAPVVSVNAPVSQSPDHVGLLHRPALLAGSADRSSPILRGAHVRLMYLCDELGPAPATAVAAREAELGDIEDMPNRQRTALLTQTSTCMGCHSQINNLGFTFESYSPFGGYRATEPIFNPDGSFRKQFAIDTKVGDPKIESTGPVALNSSTELVNALAVSRKAQACFARKVFEYYKVRSQQLANDSCLLSETSSSTAALSLQRVIVDNIANEDIFWRKDTTGDP